MNIIIYLEEGTMYFKQTVGDALDILELSRFYSQDPPDPATTAQIEEARAKLVAELGRLKISTEASVIEYRQQGLSAQAGELLRQLQKLCGISSAVPATPPAPYRTEEIPS